MGSTNFFPILFALCFFLFFHCYLAQLLGQGTSPWQSLRHGSLRECKFDKLQAFEPIQSLQSEGGKTEFYDFFNEQFHCVGIDIVRRTVEPHGLVLPRYFNVPTLLYIIQGGGIIGPTFTGCPATYEQQFQQFEQSHVFDGQRLSYKFSDEHQKVHRFRQGDVIALPSSVSHWIYNDGNAPVVTIYVLDISSSSNQLDPTPRVFLLAGKVKSNQPSSKLLAMENNIFSGFNVKLLSEALGVSSKVARRLQSENDPRGEIVRLKHGLTLLKLFASLQQVEQEQPKEQYKQSQYQQGQYKGGSYNGLDETFCAMRVTQNIDDPNHDDTYNPRVGRITHLNSQKFPMLKVVQMSLVKVNLYQNSLLSPFWNVNAHSVMYITQGRARVEVVNNKGNIVFNNELCHGQLLIIPQNYVVIMKAQKEGCEYIAFKTNPNSMVSHFVGKNSIIHAFPENIVANAYRISREEARRLKHGREDEIGVFTPRCSYKSY